MNGMYLFENLPAGDYEIVFDASMVPGGQDYEFTSANMGSGETDSNVNETGSTGTISFDPLITVTLYDFNTGLPIATVLTDGDGMYLFEDVPAGDYYIEFDPSTSSVANGFEFTSSGMGNGSNDSNVGSNGQTDLIDFDPTMGDDLTIDAGLFPAADIGDLLFLDVDGDGIQDAGESGVEGATVTLYDSNTGLAVATVLTDANGNYLFEDIASGDYYIEFDLSTVTSPGVSDYLFTTSGAGDGTNDSEADANGLTPSQRWVLRMCKSYYLML